MELTYGHRKDEIFNGIVFNFDILPKDKGIRINLSYEFDYGALPGITLGPSILFDNNKCYFGTNLNFYWGPGVYIYLNNNFYFKTEDIYDTGVLLKYLFITNGRFDPFKT